jgi:ABC-type dipeptide/oligopeptide/nickel transport system permease component
MVGFIRSWGVFILRRLGYLIVSLLGVSIITFGATRLLGNPVYLLVGTTYTKEMVENTTRELGLDRPVYEQYARYMFNLLHGDLGQSRYTFNPVNVDIQRRLPATLELATYSLLLGALWAIPAGCLAGRYRNSLFARIADFIARAGVSVPNFWLGLILIFLLYAVLHLLPPPLGRLSADTAVPPTITGWYTIDSLVAGNLKTFWASLKQLMMPALTLAFTTSPSLFQITRNTTESVYQTDYMRTAKSFGLSVWTIVRYALKNILVPVLTMLAMTYGYLIGGTVLVEVVFAWPGLGLYAVDAMNHSDFEPIVGVVLLSALAYILVYLVTDIINALIDPRIRMEGL